jgi:hypothetical protein
MMRSLIGLTLLMLAGCGDPLVGLDYRGDPMATVQGQVVLGGTATPAGGLYVVVGWHREATPDTWTGEVVDVSGGFPASYLLDLLGPPPDSALNVDPETQKKLGFAFLALMEDVNGNGELDVDQTGRGLPAGPDRFRGGAETLLLAYAADPFPAGSRIAKELGTELSVGYHLMKADEKFKCTWDEDHNDWLCPNARTELRKVPFSTPVDLKVIDKPSEWAPVHAPDWLFL